MSLLNFLDSSLLYTALFFCCPACITCILDSVTQTELLQVQQVAFLELHDFLIKSSKDSLPLKLMFSSFT